ncbi:MAG: hypothetical protein CMP59_09295 [Flavobacteriales bacterium]|nr:hypothetical protein [Flavobacteriales bacterium]|tara:strand:- start:3124 stop:3351 length:228 start_codon:yes stop_codon:yes gene_type:complete
MDKKVKKIMASVFEIDRKSIDENSSSENIENWDSLLHMNLVVALEEEFDVEFGEDEIIEMMDYESIIEALNRHLN